jgi:hypothetical protein
MKKSFLKKALAVLIILIFILAVSFYALYKSSFGKKLVKKYLSEKIEFLNNFNLKSFKYDWNSFSMKLIKGNNHIYLFGNIFPLNATYEAEFKNLSQIDKNFQGALTSQGNIKYTNYTSVVGSVLFANGYGNMNLQCMHKCVGVFNGSSFDTQEFLKMIKLNFPYIKGVNDLGLVITKKYIKAVSNFKGFFKYYQIYFPKFYANVKAKIKSRNDYIANIKFYSPLIKGRVSINKTPSGEKLKGRVSLTLLSIRYITLYPLQGRDEINYAYSTQSGLLKFSSEDFSGYVDNSGINILLNNLSSSKFFDYLHLKPVFKGKVSGNITIKNKKGSFNFLINNAIVLPNNIIKRIEEITGYRFPVLSKLFLKGQFDNKKIVFNMLSNANNNTTFSIQNGVIFYNGKFHYKLSAVYNNRVKYDFYISNKKVKLLDKTTSYQYKQETLIE